MNEYKLLIDGELVDGAATMAVINPATGEAFATCPRANAAQLDLAVAAAKRAFPAWSARTLAERASFLNTLADALEARVGAFARLLTEEQGKPLDQATFEMMGCAFVLRAFAGMELPPVTLRDDARGRVVEMRVPLGVVAAITPWNFPVILLMNKVGPALLAGNTIVAKPAPTTPLTSLLFGTLCADILPPGVMNIICDANDLGELLTSHPDVAKVAFTGSTATGSKVMASAAGSIKRVTLELGGNDAAVVLDDMDPVLAAGKVFDGAMVNSGQVCVAIKRAYVPDGLYEDFLTEIGRLAREAVVDDGLKQGTQLGPVQNKAQYEKLKELLEDSRARGTIVAGGAALDRPGYFIPPTIVRDLPDDARLVREEQFGPILPVLRYTDIEEVLARVNDSEFGLAGSVWSGDVARAETIAARIESGTAWVNQTMAIDPSIPFRGAKQSGIGGELGLDGLREYTQARIVNSAPALA